MELRDILKSLTSNLLLGDETAGDYTEVETTGFLAAKGNAKAFRDEYPSGIWVPAGAQAAPDEENYTIGGVPVRLYAFNGTTTEERISNSFEIPHDYMDGEDIEIHLHFMPSTTGSGNVKFFFDWTYIPVGGAPETQTSLSFVEAISASTQYNHYIAAFGFLPANGYELGDKILFNVRRDPSDAEDTYAADAIFLQCAIHIPVDANGSRQRYTK